MLNEKMPSKDRDKPGRLNIDIGPAGDPINGYFSTLGNAVGEHTRCRVIWLRRAEPDTRQYVAEYGWKDSLAVYGFEGDLEYFNILYTTIFLHMSKIFFPSPDPNRTLDENLIDLRRLGLNWLQMAEVYGWHKVVEPEFHFGMEPGKEYWYHTQNRQLATNYQVGGQFKRWTHKAFAKAGIALEIISSVDSRRAEREGYRASVASGYVGRVTERLRAARGERENTVGAELVLLSAAKAIEDMVDADFPDLTSFKNENPEFNPAAYRRGMQFGNEADLNTSSRMGGSSKGAVGSGQ